MIFPKPAMRTWVRGVPVLVTLSLLGATSRCDLRATTHGLTDDSSLGCSLCPVIPGDLGGTFRLIEMPQPSGSETRVFRVDDVYWLARVGTDVRITGSGTYSVREGDASSRGEHRLVLDLRVGDDPVREFDSGPVPLGDDGEGIDIGICDCGPLAPGTLIHVKSLPFPHAD